LSAIAFLGADLPAVTNLNDIASLYEANEDAHIVLYEDEQIKFDCECIDCGHKMKSDKHCNEIKCPECGGQMRREERPGPGQNTNNKKGSEYTMANGIKIQEVEGKKFVALEDYEKVELDKQETDKLKKEFEDAQVKIKKYEADQVALKEEARVKDIQQFIADKCNKTTMNFLPKQKDVVMALMESFDTEKKMEFTEESKTIELTQSELFKKFIELQPNMATDKFNELSVGGNGKTEPENDLDKIKKYAAENKVSFTDAAIQLFPQGDYKIEDK